jgi:predicted nucleotidyltransferase
MTDGGRQAAPDAPELAHEVVAVVRRVFGDALLGAYLHGSAVLGGLRATSDIDVLGVLDRPTAESERRAIVEGLLEISGRRARRGPARPVELTLVVQADVRPWHYPPMAEFQYGEWLRDVYETGATPSPEVSPDLATLITMALAGNRPLAGPPPAEVLDPVPLQDVRRAIVAGIPGLFRDLQSDTRNVLLTLARIWSTLATNEIRPKDAAAAWAIDSLPKEHRNLMVLARDLYLAGIDDDRQWANLAPEARALAAHIVGEVAELAPE